MNATTIYKNIFSAAVILLIAGLVMFLNKDISRQQPQTASPNLDQPTQTGEQINTQPNLNDPPPPQYATVKDVIDSITIELDTGHKIRYLGVRTPNVLNEVRCFGKEALLANESIIGKKVRLEEDPVLPRSRDGAWTRYVFALKTPEQIAEEEEEERKREEAASSQTEPLIPELELPPGMEDIPTPSPVPSEVLAEQAARAELTKNDDYMVNERILEAGLGFPVLSEDMIYHSRLASSVKYSSATAKGLWRACEVTNEEGIGLQTQLIEQCVIKGSATKSGLKIYRTPGCPSYRYSVVLSYKQGKWFCSSEEAESAGFTRATDCPPKEEDDSVKQPDSEESSSDVENTDQLEQPTGKATDQPEFSD